MREVLLTLALLASAPGLTLAKSDVDVHFIKTSSVQITADTITITGSAITRLTTLSGNDEPGYAGFRIWGQPGDSTNVGARDATFVILKPSSDLPADAWRESLATAEKLRQGQPVGRIGYHSPEVTIKGGLVTAVSGHGFLYPKPGNAPPIGVGSKPAEAPSWSGTWWTRFANGVNQHVALGEGTCRGGNDHGWASMGKLDHDGDRIIVTYDDDRLERWTPVGHRMVVEHWHPASAYPNAKPVVGIAARTGWSTPE